MEEALAEVRRREKPGRTRGIGEERDEVGKGGKDEKQEDDKRYK